MEKFNVVVQTAFLGDLLLAIPLLRQIRETDPESSLILVCRQGLGTLMTELQLVDVVYEIKKNDACSYRQVCNQLRKKNIKWIFSPHESLRTAFFVGSLRADKKIGFFHWWNFFIFSSRVKKMSSLPEALRQLSLLQDLRPKLAEKIKQYQQQNPTSDAGVVPDWASMNLKDRVPVSDFNFPKTPMVCLFPGSVWPTKRWTQNGFSDLGKKLQGVGYTVYVLGGRGEEEFCASISSQIPGAKSLAGQTTLLQTLQILRHSQLVISNDSASHHLAAVVGTPAISIFGPTIPEFGFRSWQNQNRIIENKNLRCRPCGPHGHRVCPIGTHECMTSISANEVFQVAQEFLAASGR